MSVTPPTAARYLRLLEPWVAHAKRHAYVPPARPDLTCYGSGYDGWGVQTNQKAFAALAVLAADPETDERRTGISRDELLDLALRVLRFSLESHHEGSFHCTDGKRWGHTWISGLGIERMMHGVDALDAHLTPHDRDLLRRVLVSESDWLLDHHPMRAGLVEDNVPESNLWNGAILHRTAALYPDAPRADEYRRRGSQYLVNSISIPSDAESAETLDGRPVRDGFVGANFYPSYALNHHRYLNVGYMVICLSNAAMLHFHYRRAGTPAPQSLYHHVLDLWGLVRACTFPDGRLCRIGGDTRARYCYCQDYAIPAWLLVEDLAIHHGHVGATLKPHASCGLGVLGPDAPETLSAAPPESTAAECLALESGWLDQVAREQEANGDGTFLSQRCAGLHAVSPLYYTRLESDRAATLSMAAYWRRVLSVGGNAEPAPPARPIECSWSDEYHGSVLQRGERRIASWTWRSAEPPIGLCVPTDRSDLAEWKENLCGHVTGEGRWNTIEVLENRQWPFGGGFATTGRVAHASKNMVAEGQSDERVALQDIACVALPDDATVAVFQRALAADRRSFVRDVRSVCLLVPNDLFNGGGRTWRSGGGELTLAGPAERDEVLDLRSPWACVDGALSVIAAYGIDTLRLVRRAGRNIGLRSDAHHDRVRAGGTLYADELCGTVDLPLRSVDPGEMLFDAGFVVRVGDGPEATAARAERLQAGPSPVCEGEGVRAILTEGADGATYLAAVNFGLGEGRVSCPVGPSQTLTDLLDEGGMRMQTGEGRVRVTVPGGKATLVRIGE